MRQNFGNASAAAAVLGTRAYLLNLRLSAMAGPTSAFLAGECASAFLQCVHCLLGCARPRLSRRIVGEYPHPTRQPPPAASQSS